MSLPEKITKKNSKQKHQTQRLRVTHRRGRRVHNLCWEKPILEQRSVKRQEIALVHNNGKTRADIRTTRLWWRLNRARAHVNKTKLLVHHPWDSKKYPHPSANLVTAKVHNGGLCYKQSNRKFCMMTSYTSFSHQICCVYRYLNVGEFWKMDTHTHMYLWILLTLSINMPRDSSLSTN